MKTRIAVALFLIGSVGLTTSELSAAVPLQTEDSIIQAESLLEKGDIPGAQKVLEDFTAKLPGFWKPLRETPEGIVGYFWDQNEFESYIRFHKKTLSKKVFWRRSSYSKAFFHLALIEAEKGKYDLAILLLDKALTLEPDHPLLLCEKAFALSKIKHFQEAYEYYIRALSTRPWISDLQRASALRGAGVALIDLDRLDLAETFLKKSLEVEPNNKNALSELDYIREIKQDKKERGNENLSSR